MERTVSRVDPPGKEGRGGSGATLPTTDEALDAPPPCELACVLTVHTLFRRPVFRDPCAAHAVARLQPRTLPPRRAAWLAWVLMPDHWQGLLVCGGAESLAALAGRFKAMTTRAVAPGHRVNGWLWERSFHAQPLDAQASLVDAARGIVAAPRRAGLVDRVDRYPYWGSAWSPGNYGPACDGRVATGAGSA